MEESNKPCSDCPEFLALEGEHVVLVYSGGDPMSMFSRVKLAIRGGDETVVRRWKTPTVSDSGAIQYDSSDPWPPVPEGYEPLESTPHTVRPRWCPCVWRAIDVVHSDTGLLVLHFLCINPSRNPEIPGVAEVRLSDCEGCKIRRETLTDFDSLLG